MSFALIVSLAPKFITFLFHQGIHGVRVTSAMQFKLENDLVCRQQEIQTDRSNQLFALIWCARGGVIDKVKTVASLSSRCHLEVVGTHPKPTYEATNIITALKSTPVVTYPVPNFQRSSTVPSSYPCPVS